MHLEQLPSGSWRVTVSHEGARRRGTANGKNAARRLGAQMMLEMGARPTFAPTVQEVLDAHLAEATYSPRTREQIDRAHDAIPDVFKARQAADVTPIVVAALWREMAAKKESPHTVLRARDLLSTAWKRALTYEWVHADPFAIVRPPAAPSSKGITPPTPEQVRRLIAAAEGRDLALWLRLAAVTGARRGELCGLQWKDLRLDRGELVIRRNVTDQAGGGTAQTEGKTGAKGHRVIPLDLPTIAALKAHQRIVGCPWVFSHDGVNPWRPSYVTLEFSRLCERVDTACRVHDLRHYAATQWLADGTSPANVAYLLGHTNPATTLRVYAHWIPAQGREVVTRNAAKLDA